MTNICAMWRRHLHHGAHTLNGLVSRVWISYLKAYSWNQISFSLKERDDSTFFYLKKTHQKHVIIQRGFYFVKHIWRRSLKHPGFVDQRNKEADIKWVIITFRLYVAPPRGFPLFFFFRIHTDGAYTVCMCITAIQEKLGHRLNIGLFNVLPH